MNVIRHLSAVTHHILVSCSYSAYGFLISFAIIIDISNIAPACPSWWRSILIHSWCAWRPTSSLLPGSRFCPATAGPLSICYPSPCRMRSHSFSFTSAFLWVLNKGCQSYVIEMLKKQHTHPHATAQPEGAYAHAITHVHGRVIPCSFRTQTTHTHKHTHTSTDQDVKD